MTAEIPRDDSSFLNKCSTEKLCLLADVMLVSMTILSYGQPKKAVFNIERVY
jgi:hypothetical protein